MPRWACSPRGWARTSSPPSTAGQFKIHVRARTGTRIEETAALCDHIDATIREQIPANEIVTIVDNIGLPYSGLNLSYSTSAPVGPADADIQVQLSAEHHPTAAYVEKLRTVLAREYPGVTFYALPVDIVTQILNFGLSAPIDIQIVGPNLYGNRALAERMLNEVRYVPGAADARIQQPFDLPQLDGGRGPHPRPDRRPDPAERGPEPAGRAQRQLPDHAQLLSRSQERRHLQRRRAWPRSTAWTRWPSSRACPSPAPAPRARTRLAGAGAAPGAAAPPSTGAPGAATPVQILGNLATIVPGAEMGTVSHYDIQPVIDIYTNVDGTDLGTVTRAMEQHHPRA